MVLELVNLEKKKKPKTEKQMEQFKLAQQKRKENIEEKNYEKKFEASKFLMEHEKNVKKQTEQNNLKKKI